MTSFAVVVPPPRIVTLEEAKRQLRVRHDDDDAEIVALVDVATATIDGPGGWLGRALGPQTLELRLAGFGCGPICLPFPPVVALTSVVSISPAEAEVTHELAAFRLESGSQLCPVSRTWPSTAARSDAVRIRYAAGWPMVGSPEAWTGPAPIRHAILMLIARLYAQRGEDQSVALAEDRTISALLAPWRIWSF